MLQKDTVETKTLELLRSLMDEELLSSTRLVGGTSLALQLGHRKSTDLDLFTTEKPNIDSIVENLGYKYNYQPTLITQYTTIGFIDGIKIDVMYHPFKWIDKPITEDNFRLASIKDIAAMKLHAIANSGQRPKDFVDIAFLSQYFSYYEMKEMALDKYPKYNSIIIDKAIIFFDDINKEAVEDIKMIDTKLKWSKIENRIIKMTDEPFAVFSKAPLEKTNSKKR